MHKRKQRGAIAIALFVVLGLAGAAVVGGYRLWGSAHSPPVVGVVRVTEIRLAPEVGGQLAAIKVQKGTLVSAGDVVAELSALELTAAVGQARAALAEAIASRDHVYAGVRDEEIASLAAEIAKSKARLEYKQMQLTRTSELAGDDYATQQGLDEAQKDVASARADVAEAEANYKAATAGPTKEELAIADAGVEAATSALRVLERRLDKTILRAPANGVVTEIVAEVGEAIRAGQPVLVLEESGKQFLSFNVREIPCWALLSGATLKSYDKERPKRLLALLHELMPLGAFATWQAERAVGDHDLNTLRLRIDLLADQTQYKPGMTVSLNR